MKDLWIEVCKLEKIKIIYAYTFFSFFFYFFLFHAQTFCQIYRRNFHKRNIPLFVKSNHRKKFNKFLIQIKVNWKARRNRVNFPQQFCQNRQICYWSWIYSQTISILKRVIPIDPNRTVFRQILCALCSSIE